MEDVTLRLRAEDLVWQEVDDEIVVLDKKTSSYLGLNASGSHLWRLLEAGASVATLRASLQAKFALTLERAAEDTESFVQTLRARGLLV